MGQKCKAKNFLNFGKNDFRAIEIEKLSLRVLKKQIYTLTSVNQNINIEGLNERFDRLCVFDSNEKINDTKYLSYSKLIAVGATHEFSAIHSKNSLHDLQNFFDTKKGWLFGYFNYDLKNEIEQLNSENDDKIGFPILQFYSPEVVLQVENENVFVFYNDDFVSEQKAKMIFDLCFISVSKEKIQDAKNVNIQSKITKEQYIGSVEKLKQHIRKGNIYEINFCQEFFAENAEINTVDIYKKLNAISEAPFSAYCKFGTNYLLCASPERFLQKQSNRLISQPIKGTIKRSEIKTDDDKLKDDLLNNKKERSENVMIVDLVRNDLSRIAKKGSVSVDELFGIYSFKQVHQMISTVSCEIDPAISFTEIIRNMFPMGSMTGAPKISAMKLIEQYESTKRGLYSGAVGYISPEGDFDFNVVIRSILYNSQNKYLSFMVGSAITDKAEAEKEYEECLLKAKAMFEVLQISNNKKVQV
ncbi:MAG: anthranilate synthase component I family protein [Bacteroidetes bacterium]|nr:anthranilate synthase component I family protein [Bacteroidota bacterium]